MRLLQVLSARAVRFVAIKASVYVPDVVKSLQERYGFVITPKTPEEMLGPYASDPRPLTFGHGRLPLPDGGAILIESLQIYPQLVLVDALTSPGAPASTDQADAVLDDFLGLQPNVLEHSMTRRAYTSQLDVELDVPLDAVSPVTGPLGIALAGLLATYLDSEAALVPFQAASFVMMTDPTRRVIPGDFRVERRMREAKEPYTSNCYFSQAPLRTSHHLVALESFERLVRETSGSGSPAPTA